jgi:hypothetical protein
MMTVEQMRQLPQAIQEGIYKQFYSAYLLAVESDRMDLEIDYVKSIDQAREIFNLSTVTAEKLEAAVRYSHKWAAKILREYNK